MTLPDVTVALGTIPSGVGGDSNRVAVTKMVAAINACIAAINAGVGGTAFDPSGLIAADAAETAARIAALTAETAARISGDSASQAYADYLFASLGSGGASYVPTPSIGSFYQSSDNGDHALAVARAWAAGSPAVFGPGQFQFKTALPMAEGGVLIGAGPTRVSLTTNDPTGGATRITCAGTGIVNNVVLDPNATSSKRRRMAISNIYFIGPGGSTTAVGIDGEMGGSVEGCRFEGFKHAIRNKSSFLCYYNDNRFDYTNDWAVILSDFNGGLMSGNHWNTRCNGMLNICDQIGTTGSTTGGTGRPYRITGSSISFGNTYNGITGVRLRGQYEYDNNYHEHYGTTVSGSTMLDLYIYQFDQTSIDVHNNTFSCASRCKAGIRIRGSATFLCSAKGRITGNSFYGVSVAGSPPILFGDDDGTHNFISDLRIFDNSWDTGLTPATAILNWGASTVYRPLVRSRGTPALACAGATFVNCPIAATANKTMDNAASLVVRVQGSGGDYYNAPKDGIYEIHAYAAGSGTPGATFEAGIYLDGTQVESVMNTALNNALHIHAFVNVVRNQDIMLKCRNGTTIAVFDFCARWVGDGNS